MARETIPPSEVAGTVGPGDGATIATTNPLPQLADSQPLQRGAAAPEAPATPGTPNSKSTEPLPIATTRALPAYPGAAAGTDEVDRTSARRRLFLRLGLTLALLLLAVESFYLAPFMDPVASAPMRTPVPVPLAEVQPYGVNTFLHKEVDRWKKDKTFQMAQEMGVGWIKQQFPWAELEYRVDPSPGREFWDVKNNQNAWDKFDGIVDLAEQHGLRIIARIDSAPGWSHPDNPDPKAPPSAEHMTDFGKFIDTFVKRYKGRIAAIQVWNEPNLKGEWATGRPVDAEEYVELLKTAYTAAKAADPNMIVLAAPLATNNERLEYNGNLNEFDYLQGMYDAGAKSYFDAMAANAYGKEFAPEDPPSREKLNFRRVELLHEVMVKNGDGNKAVWFNEYGWNASPHTMPKEKLLWGRVSPEEQAEYTVRGIRYAQENWPWAGVSTIWYMRQVGDIPNNASEYYFGLVNPDFVAGATFRAVQEAARTDTGHAMPGTWGPLSSAIEAGPRWNISLQPDAPGGMAVVPTEPGDSIDVGFTGTGIKLTLVPPSLESPAEGTMRNARYYVTIDGTSDRVSRDLPRDASGSAYIEVQPTVKPLEPVEIVVASGLGDQLRVGRHTLSIRASAEPPSDDEEASGGGVMSPAREQISLPGIAAVTVEAERSYLLFTILTLSLVAASVLLLIALRRGSAAGVEAGTGARAVEAAPAGR